MVVILWFIMPFWPQFSGLPIGRWVDGGIPMSGGAFCNGLPDSGCPTGGADARSQPERSHPLTR